MNVLEAARTHDAQVVFTSTGGAIYGETDAVPTPETEPARPLSAYGLGKRTAEEYAAWFRGAHGLDVVTLRYGNVYGPRQDPGGDAGVVAILCDRVLRGTSRRVVAHATSGPWLQHNLVSVVEADEAASAPGTDGGADAAQAREESR